MKNQNRVCAVVVTYNRKNLLIECLEALRKQTRPLQGIYIVDNASTDGTPELLKEKGYIRELPPETLSEPWEKEFEIENLTDKKPIKIHYVRMNENTGGAGGFHEGVKRGYEKGYDWLWLMDNDAEPYSDSLAKLFKNLPNEKLSAIVCNVLNRYSKKAFTGNAGYFSKSTILKPITINNFKREGNNFIDIASFVGFMVNSKAIEKVGFPYKEFFIGYDDTEYSLRIRKYGKILYKSDSFIIHKVKNKFEFKIILGKKFFIINDLKIYWRNLYGVRNKAFIYRNYSSNFFLYLYYLKQILQIILLENDKPNEWHNLIGNLKKHSHIKDDV